MPLKSSSTHSNRYASGHKGNSKSHAQNTSKGENFAIIAMRHLLAHQEIQVLRPLQGKENILIRAGGRYISLEELLQVDEGVLGSTLYYIQTHLLGRNIGRGVNCTNVSEQIEFFNLLCSCVNPPMQEINTSHVTSQSGAKYEKMVLQPIPSWEPQSSKKKSENTRQFKQFIPQYGVPQHGVPQFNDVKPQFAPQFDEPQFTSVPAKASFSSHMREKSATTVPANSGDDFGRIAKKIEANVLRIVQERLQEQLEEHYTAIDSQIRNSETYNRDAKRALEGQLQGLIQKISEKISASCSSQINEVWPALEGIDEKIKKLRHELETLKATLETFKPQLAADLETPNFAQGEDIEDFKTVQTVGNLPSLGQKSILPQTVGDSPSLGQNSFSAFCENEGSDVDDSEKVLEKSFQKDVSNTLQNALAL